MVSPMIKFTEFSKAWKWTTKCSKAFKKVKYSLTHAPVLRMPDFLKPFKVLGDASKYASKAILLQEGLPIAFDSQNFNKADLNCAVSEQEMLVSMHAVQT